MWSYLFGPPALPEFDVTAIDEASAILIVGKKRSGATTLARRFAEQLDKPICTIGVGGDWDGPTMMNAIKVFDGEPVTVIVDDVSWDTKFMRSKELLELTMNHRRINPDMTLILTAQYTKSVPPAVRSNFDVVATFANIVDAEFIWKTWFSMMTRETFDEHVRRECRDYGVLVADNRALMHTRSGGVYRYRAPSPA